jgi:hypothetical protein
MKRKAILTAFVSLLMLVAVTISAVSAVPAAAESIKQVDCSACHNDHPGGVMTAVPSTPYPAAGASYTVAITIPEHPDGLFGTGYWIANSTVAGDTGSTTGKYAADGQTTQTYSETMTAPAGAGVYYYKVFGEDGTKSDGMTSTVLYSVTVDSTAPATTDNHDALVHSYFRLVLTPVDATSGVSSTQYRIDGGPWVSGTSATLRLPIRHRLRGVSAGSHLVEYQSTDRAGNVETIKSCSVKIG